MINDLKNLHSDLKLCGKPRNSILNVSDELLAYILAILRNRKPMLLKASEDQWSQFLSLLSSHGIIPLLYKRISCLPQELHPPEDILNQMRNTFLLSRARCLQEEKQLQEILNAYSKEGIRTLVLKGTALGRSIYPDPALRLSGDIDLLVLPEQFLLARKILEGIGYKCVENTFNKLEGLEIDENFIYQKNIPNKRMIELHWDLHAHYSMIPPLPLKEYFKRSVKVQFFETLHPIDALIYAAIHTTIIHNCEIRLIWIYDIALLAQQLNNPADWEILKDRSSKMGAGLAVEHSLKMAQSWTGIKYPNLLLKPSKSEVSLWNHTIQRNKNIYSWFKARWPKGLGPLKSLDLFIKLLRTPSLKQRINERSNRRTFG